MDIVPSASFARSDTLKKSEVTYISPSPPLLSNKSEKQHNRSKRAEKYSLLGREQHSINELEKESFAWNTVLTWLLALFALTLLPFALHYGIKKYHSRSKLSLMEEIIPTGMQSHPHLEHHYLYHQNRIPNSKENKLHVPQPIRQPRSFTEEKFDFNHYKKSGIQSNHNVKNEIKSSYNTAKDQPQPPHICMCTVRRIHKITKEVQSSTLRIPFSSSSSFLNEECERLCAQERPRMIETLEKEARERDKQNVAENLQKPESLFIEPMMNFAFPQQVLDFESRRPHLLPQLLPKIQNESKENSFISKNSSPEIFTDLNVNKRDPFSDMIRMVNKKDSEFTTSATDFADLLLTSIVPVMMQQLLNDFPPQQENFFQLEKLPSFTPKLENNSASITLPSSNLTPKHKNLSPLHVDNKTLAHDLFGFLSPLTHRQDFLENGSKAHPKDKLNIMPLVDSSEMFLKPLNHIISDLQKDALVDPSELLSFLDIIPLIVDQPLRDDVDDHIHKPPSLVLVNEGNDAIDQHLKDFINQQHPKNMNAPSRTATMDPTPLVSTPIII